MNLARRGERYPPYTWHSSKQWSGSRWPVLFSFVASRLSCSLGVRGLIIIIIKVSALEGDAMLCSYLRHSPWAHLHVMEHATSRCLPCYTSPSLHASLILLFGSTSVSTVLWSRFCSIHFPRLLWVFTRFFELISVLTVPSLVSSFARVSCCSLEDLVPLPKSGLLW